MTESTHSQLSTFNSQNLHWFAVRVSYSRELTLKSILDKENIESFIPMCYGMVMKGGKRVRHGRRRGECDIIYGCGRRLCGGGTTEE